MAPRSSATTTPVGSASRARPQPLDRHPRRDGVGLLARHRLLEMVEGRRHVARGEPGVVGLRSAITSRPSRRTVRRCTTSPPRQRPEGDGDDDDDEDHSGRGGRVGRGVAERADRSFAAPSWFGIQPVTM